LRRATFGSYGVGSINHLVAELFDSIAESGLPGFDNPVWFGLFAPAGTPAPIVQKLNNQMNGILAMPDVKQAFAKLGFEPAGGSSDALAQRVDGEIEKWTTLVREKNIHVEP
jgi:putative tricarboxylic transport membrane protein